MIFLEILAGVLGGIVGGMGMGGGTLTIPILTIFLSYEQLQTQGINLIAFLPMSVVALIIHAKNHLVAFKETWLLALIGSAFSLIGALVANHMSSGVLKNLFAVFLIGLAIWQLIEMIKKNKQDKNKMKNTNEPNKEQN